MAAFEAQHAIVDPRATIAPDVEIGPYCVIGPDVVIGSGTRLENNVTLMGRVTIGSHNHFYPGVVVGGEPQDISYRGGDTEVVIGDHNVVRECVTINRGSEKEDGVTAVGSHCFLMACSHIAHDCKVGDQVIIANGTLLGGHVHVHHNASLSGGVAVHHQHRRRPSFQLHRHGLVVDHVRTAPVHASAIRPLSQRLEPAGPAEVGGDHVHRPARPCFVEVDPLRVVGALGCDRAARSRR